MIVITDYNNNVYAITAINTTNSELNGQEDISLRVPQQNNKHLDLLDIDKLWTVTYDNVKYKIMHVKRQTVGASFNLEIHAKPEFYVDFEKSIIHENLDGSYTAQNAFRALFDGTEYNYAIIDFSASIEIEGFGGGSNRLDLFKRLLERFEYEFYISGSTVYLRHLIGQDTNFMYKYRLNASNVSQSVDAAGMFTHIKGFGDMDEGEDDYYNNAGLKREYTSPLADVVGHYEGPPIVDGRITDSETLDRYMMRAVENSLQITVEGNLHDIRKMGYREAIPKKGDRVWLIDERINLKQEIRVHAVRTTRDILGNIISCEVTFGSQSVSGRHKSDIQSVVKSFKDFVNPSGGVEIPIVNLERTGRDMIRNIHSSTNEVRYGSFGIQAVDKDDPNLVTGLNSRGWYISQDGGLTASTIADANGIIADAIYTGTLKGITLEGNEIYGGDIFQISPDRMIHLADGDMESYYNGELAVKIGGYRQEFYNRASERIASIVPLQHTNSDNRGLGVTIDDDFYSVGFMRGDISHAVFRASKVESRTVIAGPYQVNNQGNVSNVQIYANAYLHSAGSPSQSIDQPAILLSQGRNGNNTFRMYYGGYNHRAGATLQMWWREAQSRSILRFEAHDSGVSVGGTFSESSSRELKKDIQKFEGDALAVIDSLDVVNYRLKDSPDDTLHIGFISEDSPAIATRDQKSIIPYHVDGYLTASVQQLHDRVKRLEDKINAV